MILRKAMAVFLSTSLVFSSVVWAAARSPFADTAIPAAVQAELSALFEEFLSRYEQAAPEQKEDVTSQFNQSLAVFTFQLLRANQQDVSEFYAQAEATPPTVRQQAVVRYMAYQQLNSALAANDVAAAKKAVKLYRHPETSVAVVQAEAQEIPLRPDLAMDAAALATTLRALRLGVARVNREIGHDLLAGAAKLSTDALKNLEQEIRQVTRERSDDEGIVAERLVELVQAKRDGPATSIAGPDQGVLATVLAKAAEQVTRLERFRDDRVAAIQKWAQLKSDNRKARQAEADKWRAQRLRMEKAWTERQRYARTTYSYSTPPTGQWVPPSAAGTAAEMALAILIPFGLGGGMGMLASDFYWPLGLISGGLAEVMFSPLSIGLCVSALKSYKLGQERLRSLPPWERPRR